MNYGYSIFSLFATTNNHSSNTKTFSISNGSKYLKMVKPAGGQGTGIQLVDKPTKFDQSTSFMVDVDWENQYIAIDSFYEGTDADIALSLMVNSNNKLVDSPPTANGVTASPKWVFYPYSGTAFSSAFTNYKVNPGLYKIGSPSKDSHVLVTANFKLTFDR